MNYEPNKTNWKVGDLVIHDADEKAERMLMKVITIFENGRIGTEYLTREGNQPIYHNSKEVLLDPARFGIRSTKLLTPPPPSQKMIRNWDDLPANAQTVAVVESCISYLQDHHPYPANMKIDRTAFAGSRSAYSAAIYNLEKFMAELTEEIELNEMTDEEAI